MGKEWAGILREKRQDKPHNKIKSDRWGDEEQGGKRRGEWWVSSAIAKKTISALVHQ